jgi:TolA-binding protein
LKKHAEEKIELANNEIEKLRKSTQVEIQTLRAELRKAEIKISSLELSVQQKVFYFSFISNLEKKTKRNYYLSFIFLSFLIL